EVHVIAGLERRHRVIEVPVIGRRDHDGVDVGARGELAVVVVDRLLVHAGALTRRRLTLVPDVVDGDRLHVALLLRPVHDARDVRIHATAAADEADVDAVVGAEDAALGGVGHGAERGLGRRRGGNRGGRGHGAGAHLADEIAATGV